ncbi:TPA: ribosome biogenesis factor YjgA [Legionella feeleii]|uniref:Dual-action ribosomal maturation protein DarP n=1 Tax=Legionella feeleii TaxID=453 RepID=A0A0W0TMV7_9GAMM|nr:ribosome biogenesis factor YjgA [Legionella feeleii]KTC96929.1 alpha helix protein [Legionella feeleii]SPX61032.1 alpha helix protein [Legionella feeleii]STX36880.1 alpha helix protein [Legionella feeleii]
MEEPKSKSQKKRDADALQKVGVKLIALSLSKLDTLPLPPNLRQAIIDAKSIKSHGAIRRQAQLIGKLMRAADNEAILAAYETIIAEDSAQTAAFHELEQWRDRLINEGKEALTEFIDAFQPTDVQQLRQLVKKAVDEQNSGKPTGASKALFRFLRACL